MRTYPRIMILIVLSALGPYVHNIGLRMDHVAIYGSLLFVLTTGMLRSTLVCPRSSLIVIGSLTGVLVWGTAVTVGRGSDFNVGVVSAFESTLQPIAILLIVFLMSQRQSHESIRSAVRVIVKVVILCLAANALIASIHVFYDTWPMVKYFVGSSRSEIGGSSVWERAASMGRYSGLFNQPFEAGVGYSIGLVCWAYLYGVRAEFSRSIIGVGSLVMLIIGSILCVSKVALFGGFGLFVASLGVLSVYHGASGMRRLALVLLICVVTVSPLLYILGSSWSGVEYVNRFADVTNYQSGRGVQLISAGRFGDADTSVKRQYDYVMGMSPFTGFGYGHAEDAMDNGLVHLLYDGGVVNVGLYIIVVLSLLIRALRSFMPFPERILLFSLVVLSVCASYGAFAFNINRASVWLWLIFGLLMALDVRAREARVIRNLKEHCQ